ncbi:MAG: membrane protein insertion efficiency factor YidD [Actinomycetota bacterium]|nr:membrane protein insertion efficiency factor YidD [Actinomycetota bacterium]
MQRLLLIFIRVYQASRFGRPSPCRFQPSCSEYAFEAVSTHGAAHGSWLALRRIARCRPRGARGFDPVPAK